MPDLARGKLDPTELMLMERLRARFGFTKSEVKIAVALVGGLSYAEIAKKLGVSYHTTKAGVATTGQLTALIRGALDVQT